MNLSSLEDTQKVAEGISKILKSGDIVFVQGEIGVGKTTFVRFLINHLEVENGMKKSDVLSPTFNIVYEYNLGRKIIQHYDLYRLKSYKDILELGMFENSFDYIKIVEWPELIKPKPNDRIDINFNYSKSMTFRRSSRPKA